MQVGPSSGRAWANGVVSRAQFHKKQACRRIFYNLARDLKLLGIATTDSAEISLKLDLKSDLIDLDEAVRPHVRERLLRNRIVSENSQRNWKPRGTLSTNQLSELLKVRARFPHRQDVETFAVFFANWMTC